jgi:hypothetical protein
MGLLIPGKFSEADRKTLEGDGSYIFTKEEGEDENGAFSEQGRSGLANAIEFWKLADVSKSGELENLWNNVMADDKHIAGRGNKMSVAQVGKASKLLDELFVRLNEYFDNSRAIKPEKLEFVRQTLPNYFIKSEEDADGRREVVLEPMWEFWSAKNFLAVAARLQREIWLD